MRCASVVGNAAVAKVLLNAGAKVDAKDKDGKTPLMVSNTCTAEVEIFTLHNFVIFTKSKQLLQTKKKSHKCII